MYLNKVSNAKMTELTVFVYILSYWYALICRRFMCSMSISYTTASCFRLAGSSSSWKMKETYWKKTRGCAPNACSNGASRVHNWHGLRPHNICPDTSNKLKNCAMNKGEARQSIHGSNKLDACYSSARHWQSSGSSLCGWEHLECKWIILSA